MKPKLNSPKVASIFGPALFVATLGSLADIGVNVANADRAEIITVIGVYAHAWFLSFALGLPIIVLVYEFLAIRRKSQDYMRAAIKASRIWGISFATGAVTGTLVEFGLVQIWTGSLIAIGSFFFAPLFIELLAFMVEITFLVIYLFTWGIYKYQWKHWIFGLFIAIGTMWSAYQILVVNAWMNMPWGTGDLVSKVLPWMPSLGPNVANQTAMVEIFKALPSSGSGVIGNLTVSQSLGQLVTNPFIAFSNPEAIPLFLHTVTAAVASIGFLGSMFLSIKYLKNKQRKDYYAKLLKITFGVGAIASILEPIFGDIEGRFEYTYMYTKFLAAEGIPAQGGTNPLIGFLLFGDPNHFFPGFDYLRTLVGSSIAPGMASATIDFAQQDQYWLSASYYAMLIFGAVMLIFSIAYFGLFSGKINKIVRALTRRDTIDLLFTSSLFLPFMAMAAAILGWITREAGRHPWSVYGLITYNELVTPVELTWGYIALIALVEVAIGVAGTIAMYVSLQWKVKEETVSTEPTAAFKEARAS